MRNDGRVRRGRGHPSGWTRRGQDRRRQKAIASCAYIFMRSYKDLLGCPHHTRKVLLLYTPAQTYDILMSDVQAIRFAAPPDSDVREQCRH